MEPQIIRGLPIEQYHADPNFTSHSRIHDFIHRGPRFYFDRHVAHTIDRKVTEALVTGQAAEDYFFGGEEVLHERYHLKLGDCRNPANKAAKDAAIAAGRPILTREQYETILAMKASFDADCGDAQQLLLHAETQVTLRGEFCGIAVQARPDSVCFDEFAPWIMDMKTTDTLEDLLLEREGEWHPGYKLTKVYGYHTQAALARHLLAQNGYPNATSYLLIVEKKPAHRAVCVDITALLAQADLELRRVAPRLRECIETNTWPRSPKGIVKLARPNWAAEEAQP